MKLNQGIGVAVAATLVVSCNYLDPDFRAQKIKDNEYKAAWTEKVGKIDKNQTWNSAGMARISVTVAEASTIDIYTQGLETRTLLGSQTINSSGIISFDIPQGLCEMVGIYKTSASGKSFRSASVEELSKGIVEISFPKDQSASTKAPMTDAHKKALTGSTLTDPRSGMTAKIWGYEEFPGWIWSDINAAMPENKTATGQVNNFEMQSNGIFYVSPIYGVTGNTTAEIGYYYYDPTAKTDTTFVPLVDALKYDFYYDGQGYSSDEALTKLQWKNKETGEWQPCNFDHYDKKGSNSRNTNRRDDDQYNSLSILQEYGNTNEALSKIESVKGVLFQVDAPKGYMVGFYVNRTGVCCNHTTAAMNELKYYNAIIKMYDGFRFIGLEDSKTVDESKRDCNDIVMVMVPGNDGTLPGVLLPYVKDITTKKYYNADGSWSSSPKYDEATDGKKEDGSSENLAAKKQTWTFAFEDMGTIGDFDFNDVVFRVTPDTKNHTAEILLCATGGSYEADIYYKNNCIGEAHSLLGSSGLANTRKITIDPKVIATVAWPEGYSMEKNAKDFYIMVKGEKITLPEQGKTPKAICISGEWDWPTETTSITEAYPNFGEWGANYSDVKYWNWNATPAEGKTIGYHK